MQETELSSLLASTFAGVLQFIAASVPESTRALPLLSTATHSDVDAHETELRLLPGSIAAAAVQVISCWALMVAATAFPFASTATQNAVVGHATAVSFPTPGMAAALLHLSDSAALAEWPARACPLASTATQKVADTQETAVSSWARSTMAGASQAWPFLKATTVPLLVAAVQKGPGAHERAPVPPPSAMFSGVPAGSTLTSCSAPPLDHS